MVIENIIFEFFILFLYIICFYFAYKIKKLDFLIFATIFATIFENLNIIFFSNAPFGYFYSTNFLFFIFKVPLFIILAWGILLLGAYLVSLKLKMSKISRIFFIPLFVTLIDFVIEGVSVFLKFWTWVGVEGGNNIFSFIIPSNFIGWLGVSFGFILFYEYSKKKWLSSFLGYFVFLGFGFIFETISGIFGFIGSEKYISLISLILVLIGFFAYFYNRDRNSRKNVNDIFIKYKYAKYIVCMRAFFYFFALFYFIKNKFYSDLIYSIVFFISIFIEWVVLFKFFKE